MYSTTEENYLKCILALSVSDKPVSTNAIAERMENSAASVTDMVKKLAAKDLVEHIPYKGITLLKEGRDEALFLLRKHRLWECFLYNQLGFSWDELHEIAEQLEHIESVKLINRLDEFLGFPKFDPHGDPIPDQDGRTAEEDTIQLMQAPIGKKLIVKSVVDNRRLLKYLSDIQIGIGTVIQIDKKIEFDESIIVLMPDLSTLHLSPSASSQIFVKLK